MNEEDVLGSGFLEADTARYFLGSSSSSALNRSISMPLYATQLGVDANPWNTEGHLDVHHHSSNHTAVDDDVLGADITAASVLSTCRRRGKRLSKGWPKIAVIIKIVFLFTALVGVDLPDIYDVAYMRARPVGERVSLESLEKVIGLAELPPRQVQEVVHLT